MALLVLAFAVGLSELPGPPAACAPASPAAGDDRGAPPPRRRERLRLQPPGPHLVRARGADLAGAGSGDGRPSRRSEAVADAARRHRWAIAAVAVVVVAAGAFSAAQLSGFVGKVGQVQASQGRLGSPVFPGEALGIWPKGDFRVVRGDVRGPTWRWRWGSSPRRSAHSGRCDGATGAWWRWEQAR